MLEKTFTASSGQLFALQYNIFAPIYCTIKQTKPVPEALKSVASFKNFPKFNNLYEISIF